jgi:F420-dependent oxidoreductase-like protein
VPEPVQLPSPCVVVLVGPGASGKSTWAAAHFASAVIVSSDRLRALVGTGEDDIGASEDAFTLLGTIVERRLSRGLTTVIDTLGLDDEKRLGWLAAAKRHRMPCVAVTFDTTAEECRARNRGRPNQIPAKVLSAQLRSWRRVREQLPVEGFDTVVPVVPARPDPLRPDPLRVVPRAFVDATTSARRQAEGPAGLRFGLHLGSFNFSGGASGTRDALRQIAATAESAGFGAIYVMDHFRQIPQIGRPWEDFLESYTTLAYLAACTERARLGVLVTGVTYRNPAHLGKIIATLDVLSGGRAVCGIGLAWYRDEHAAYGWEFPTTLERYGLLEDALRLLPLLWGPGTPSYEGRYVKAPEAMCYPRPLQAHVPVIVGGGGERRTLRLAARYADAANVTGDKETVRRKAAILRDHCEAEGRDPATVELTHLSPVLVGADDRHVAELVERFRPRRSDPARAAAAMNAGTVTDHVGRFRELAEAGVREVMVRLPDPLGAGSMDQMSRVISAFR